MNCRCFLRLAIIAVMLFFIIRITTVATNIPTTIPTTIMAEEIPLWAPFDVLFFVLSLILTLIPENEKSKLPEYNNYNAIKHYIMWIISNKIGSFIIIINCCWLAFIEYNELSNLSAYFIVIGILFDRLVQTYDVPKFLQNNPIKKWPKNLCLKREKHRKNLTKTIIRIHKKRTRTLILSLNNTKGVILSIIALTACLVVSYFHEGQWISNVLISIGAGIITGLVFYFLSNYRNNKIIELQSEISDLTPINDTFSNLSNLNLIAQWPHLRKYSSMSPEEIAFNMMDQIDELSEHTNVISYKLHCELGFDIDNPLDRDKCKSLRESLETVSSPKEYLTWSIETYNRLLNLHNIIDDNLKNKQDTLKILQNRIF